MHLRDYLSATALSKKTSATLDALENGEVEKLVILKNNAPKAILMSIDAYEAMEEEMEDFHLVRRTSLRWGDEKATNGF